MNCREDWTVHKNYKYEQNLINQWNFIVLDAKKIEYPF